MGANEMVTHDARWGDSAVSVCLLLATREARANPSRRRRCLSSERRQSEKTEKAKT